MPKRQLLDWNRLYENIGTKFIYWSNLISANLPSFPSKWFDWLKWILIIGAISAIEKQSPDEYLGTIIYISYMAILIDSFYYVYNILYKIYLEKEIASVDESYNKLRDTEHFPEGELGNIILRGFENYKMIITSISMFLAVFVTVAIFILINHIVNLYVSSHLSL